jgi:hydroxyacylglutathione hydrolase
LGYLEGGYNSWAAAHPEKV